MYLTVAMVTLSPYRLSRVLLYVELTPESGRTQSNKKGNENPSPLTFHIRHIHRAACVLRYWIHFRYRNKAHFSTAFLKDSQNSAINAECCLHFFIDFVCWLRVCFKWRVGARQLPYKIPILNSWNGRLTSLMKHSTNWVQGILFPHSTRCS